MRCKSSRLGLFLIFFMAAFLGMGEFHAALSLPPCKMMIHHCDYICSKPPSYICDHSYQCSNCWTKADYDYLCPPCRPGEIDYWREGKGLTRSSHGASENRTPKRNASPAAETEKTYEFTHTLEGEWDDVYGYVGFQYHSQTDNKDYMICLIGLYVEDRGNGVYKSEPWDKKVFWIDVGDGSPLFVCAIYAPNYEEDGVVYDNVYWAPNFVYLQEGTDGKKIVTPCDMWLFLDEDDEVEEVWIDIYSPDGEYTKSKELGIGDQISAYLPAIDTSDAGSFYAIVPELHFYTVKSQPLFLYEHMTPNVDFTFEPTKGIIDFENVDLQFLLYGETESEEGVFDFAFSTPKNINLKWGDKPAKTENWFLHAISGILNFFIPK